MKSRVIFSVAVLLSSNFAFAGLSFTESFNGYAEGSKASANNTNKAAAPVLWTEEAYTQIVSYANAKTYKGLESVPVVKNSKITTDSIARAGTGESMLLFKYAAGIESWSEQRFEINQAVLGKKGVQDFWLQYDVYIPSNYKLHDANPTSGNYVGGGHKVLTLFADAYSYPNTTLILGEVFFRKTKTGAAGDDGSGYNDGTLSTYKNGERIYTYFPADDNRIIKWMDALTDLGTWQRRTLHFKMPTSETSKDGMLEVWLKRANGTIMKVIDRKNETFYGYNQNYINAGYLNGWNNDGFESETFMLVDNVIMSDDVSAVDPSAIFLGSKSMPPDAKLILGSN